MRVQLLATQPGLALYQVSGSDTAVVVDTDDMNAFDPVPVNVAIAQEGWKEPPTTFSAPSTWNELAENAVDEFKITPSLPQRSTNRTYRAPNKVSREILRGISAYRVRGTALGVDEPLVSLANKLIDGASVTADELKVFSDAHQKGLGTAPNGATSLSGSNIAYLITGGESGREWVKRIATQSAQFATQKAAKSAPAAPAVPPANAPATPATPQGSPAPSGGPDAPKTPTTADFGKQTTDPNDPDGWVDVTKPHQFAPDSDDPNACAACGNEEGDQLHDPTAVADFQKQLDQQAGSETPAEAPVTAAGFEYDPQNTYFGKMAGQDLLDGIDDSGPTDDGDPEDVPNGADDAMDADDDSGTAIGVTGMLMMTPDGKWQEYENGQWTDTEAPDPDSDELVQLDQESAQALADAMSPDAEDQADGGADEEAEGDAPLMGGPSKVKKLNDGVYALRISEEQLFKLAEPELDLDFYDRFFAGVPYVDPAVRSKNAHNQPRQAGGKFGQSGGSSGGGAAPTAAPSSSDSAPAAPAGGDSTDSGGGTSDTPEPVARLSKEHELVGDVGARIQQYIDENKPKDDGDTPAAGTPDATDTPVTSAAAPDPALAPPTVDSPDAAPVSATDPTSTDNSGDDSGGGPDNSDATPLYLAVVDPNDTQAVIKLLAIIPGEGDSPVECYDRKGSEWEADPDDLTALQGPTPPPTVELDDTNELQDVENQIAGQDSSADSGAGDTTDTTTESVAAAGIVAAYLPNGEIAFATITTHSVDENGALTASQSQGAVLLEPYGDESTWPADVTQRLAEFVENSPKDVQNAQRLRDYWAHGAGAAKVRWGQPGDWERCVHHVSKFMGDRAKGYCQLRHKDATGFYAGHAPTEQTVHASAASLPLTEEGWLDHGVFGYNAQERRAMAKTGEALSDGSFPIRNKPDLDKAIKQYSELDPESRLEVRKHINKRAKALGIADQIPQNWKNAAAIDDFETDLAEALTASIEMDEPGDARATLEMAFSADELEELEISEFKAFSPGQRRKMAGSGSAMPDGSFPIKTKADARRAVKAYGRAKNKSAAKKHIVRRAKAVGASDVIPETWKAASTIETPTELGVGSKEEIEKNSPETAEEVQTGARFRIPMLIPEGVSSGDGRTFAENSVTSRDTPLALMWQIESDDGHKSSVIVGRIDSIERIDGGIGNCFGVFDTGPNGQEAERMVRAGMLRGVSADLDEFEAQVHEPDDENTVTSTKLTVNKGRVMGATLVAKPAFPDVVIELIDEGDDVDDYAESTPAVAAAALVAAAAPVTPPGGWFSDPKLSGPTPLTVDDEGRVYGHIALWDVDHIGLPFGTRAPKSLSDYAYFRTGVVRTSEGSDIPVGQLTLSGGHAPLSMTASDAVKHYDDTKSAVADVAAGEDRHGIWVAGALRPEVTPEQVRSLRASAPSGDWRPIRGKLELVAVCQVNVPGFPVARARVASGMVQALVAAGSGPLLDMKIESMAASASFSERLAALEGAQHRALEAEADAAKARLLPFIEEKRAALTAAAQTARQRVEERRAELNAQAEAIRARVAALRPQETGEEGTTEEEPVTASTEAAKPAFNLNITVNVDPRDNETTEQTIRDAITAALEVVPPFRSGEAPEGSQR